MTRPYRVVSIQVCLVGGGPLADPVLRALGMTVQLHAAPGPQGADHLKGTVPYDIERTAASMDRIT